MDQNTMSGCRDITQVRIREGSSGQEHGRERERSVTGELSKRDSL